MVAIAPFRALRYNPELIGSLSRVLAPPYDVISPAEQEQLYNASPYNIVRLILGKQSSNDTPHANRYTRAKATFEEWRRSRVLIRDEALAVYLTEQTFTWQGQPLRRLGFVALLEFEGSVPEQVLAHEATFEAPKADRAKLLDAIRANLSPLFCVAPDPQQRTYALLTQISRDQPSLATARFGDEQVRVWAITDAKTIHTIASPLAGMRVLIADGHHRFEVAFSRRSLCPAVMSHFCLLEDPALVVRPIHRVIRVAPEAKAAWRARLQALCRLEPASSLDHVVRWLATGQEQGRFGYYEEGCCYTASLHAEVLAAWFLRASVPLALAGLDVAILHEAIFPELLGPASSRPVAHATPGTNHVCRYTPDAVQAIEMVRRHEGDCVWLLRPIPLPQVFALAAQGFTLPQKSTYFYPKVLSGLFINPFD